MKFSETQIDFLINSTHDINLATGSIRSGKTFIQIIRTIEFITGTQSLENVDVLFIGKTLGALSRNVTHHFLSIAEENGHAGQFQVYRVGKSITEVVYVPKNITIYCVGANDASAESKIRGMTAQFLLGDEVTLWDHEIFMQSIGRVSAGLRYKLFSCNPDSPSHYINTEVINNQEIDCKVWHFNLLDNPGLSEGYKQQLKNLYSGVFAQRFLEGKWVIAEGVVYDRFDRQQHLFKTNPDQAKVKEYVIGIDWGYDHPLAMCLFLVDYDGRYWMIDELYLKHQLIDKSLINIMQQRGWFNLPFHNRQVKPSYAYADPARPDYIAQFYKLANITTVPAFNDVVPGIQMVQENLANGPKLMIKETCINMIKEMESYSWKVSKAGISRDEPEKIMDDLADSLRYVIFTRERSRVRVLPNNPFSN
jgi:PBSX family phage terminase large subunit